MKKPILIMLIIWVITIAPGFAWAIPFKVDGGASSVTIQQTGGFGPTSIAPTINPGLGDIAFNLGHNASHTFSFFDLSVNGYLHGDANVAATLAFSEPETSSASFAGFGSWMTIFGIWSSGVLQWNGIQTVNLTNGDFFTVALSPINGSGWGNTASVFATVTYSNAGAPAPVPEPASLLMLGIALIALAGLGRRKVFNK